MIVMRREEKFDGMRKSFILIKPTLHDYYFIFLKTME